MNTTPIGRLLATLITLSFTIFLQACATTAEPSAADIAATQAQLLRQAREWDAAIVRKDAAATSANMADDFRIINGEGGIADKTSFLANILSDKLQIDPYSVEDLEIRRYGDVALLSGTTKMTGRYEGNGFTSQYRYIDVYVLRDGVWKVASVQITKLPD